MPDYELLTMMLSALRWRQNNGTITMVTDSAGAAFFRRAGLERLWSAPIDTRLDDMDARLDPRRFWAAGKLWALRGERTPCVMLDTDAIVWQPLDARLGSAVVAAHREALNPAVYPEPHAAFVFAEGYAFPAAWDFTRPAANTAFLYLPDEGFKTRYVDAAFAFMYALENETDPTVSMCFAEQRILPMCAAAEGVALETLLDEQALDEQSLLTHLWGHKRVLETDAEQRLEYCLRCTAQLLSAYPDWADTLSANAATRRYWQELQLGTAQRPSARNA
ncbi:MAG: hypothetical protein K6G54_02425 [Oscillospiraceae bacterium]|nr:hypothetical protein [Oscillospiraceae bacterium]